MYEAVFGAMETFWESQTRKNVCFKIWPQIRNILLLTHAGKNQLFAEIKFQKHLGGLLKFWDVEKSSL